MQLRALAIILVGGCIFGLLLYLPFYLWFRWRRIKDRSVAPGRFGKRLPQRELKWVALTVALLLVGFAQGRVAPDTWFGAQMQTRLGRGVLALILAVFITVIRVAWLVLRARATGTPIQWRRPRSEDD